MARGRRALVAEELFDPATAEFTASISANDYIQSALVVAKPEPLAAAAMLGRLGDAKEIAAAVRYLADSEFITGHVLNVDGGSVAGRR